MNMRRKLKKYLIPHKKNRYKPHLLRMEGVVAVALVIVLLFTGAYLVGQGIRSNNGFLAAVITSVLVDLANTDRAGNGLTPLHVNPVLTEAAQMKANDMAAHGYFAHVSPSGVTPWYWFRQAGYDFLYAGENLAVRFSDSADVERAWMLSPTHRANILNGYFTEIGIAMADGFYEGQPTIFVVQLFGSPQSEPQSIAPAAKPAAGAAQAAQSPVKILHSDSTFIAVKSVPQEQGSVAGEESKVAAVSQSAPASPSLWKRIAASPKTALGSVYLTLATLIFLVMTLMIAVEIRRQHPLHIAYGTGLLVLMAALLYVYQSTLFGSVVVL